MFSATYARQLAQDARAREVVREHQINQTVVGSRMLSEHHASARIGAVGNGYQVRSGFDSLTFINHYSHTPFAPSNQSTQRSRNETRLAGQSFHAVALRCHTRGDLRTQPDCRNIYADEISLTISPAPVNHVNDAAGTIHAHAS